MKKIYLIIILFSFYKISYSQEITLLTADCNNATFRIFRPSTPNGNYNMSFNVRNAYSNFTEFSPGFGRTVNMVGNYGTFSIPIASFGGYLTIEVYRPYLGAATIFDGISGFFFKDKVYFNLPLTVTPGYGLSACQNSAYELFITDQSSFVSPFGTGSSSLQPGWFNTNPLYSVKILVSGANTGVYTDIVDNTTGGFFTPADGIDIPALALTNPGLTRFSIIEYQELGTDQVSSFGNDCNSDVITFPANTYFFETNVLAPPNLSGTNSVSVAQPLCLTNSGSVTFNASLLANGTYNLNYTLSGSNTGSFSASNVSVNSGTGTFSIPSSQLTASGNTSVSITAVIDTTTGCSSSSSIQSSFIIGEFPDVSGTNTVSAIDICLNGDGNVTITSTSLANGTYNLNYTLSGSNTGSFSASSVVFSSGSGTFTIPAIRLTNPGTTTISISNISNSITNCQSSF